MTISFRAALRSAAVAVSLLAAPAFAQEAPPPPPPPADAQLDMDDTVYSGDYMSIGAGAIYGPQYEGADEYEFFPGGALQGQVGGIGINPRAAGLALDFIADSDSKVSLSLGPVATFRTDRTKNIKDPVVARLGELDMAIEVGATAGISLNKPLTGYDSLSLSVDVKWDVNKAHEGRLIQPTISYFTPVSRGMAVALAATATHADDDYMDYYFSVTPAGTVASGLPTYRAQSGWKNWGVNGLLAVDLDGNLANGGVALIVGGGYSKLLNDAKDSPIVALRGEDDSWIVGAGVGITF